MALLATNAVSCSENEGGKANRRFLLQPELVPKSPFGNFFIPKEKDKILLAR